LAVSTALAASDFAAGTGTLLSNYVLPVSASGTIGTITPRTITVVLTGATGKVYDGTAAATLTGSNYQLGNLVDGESVSIGKASGTYASKDVASGLTVSTTLSAADFTAGTGTLLSNYVLPVSASGSIGTITPATLTIVLTGTTSKTYDGSTAATLTGANYQVSGLISGESVGIGKTSGTYATANAGTGLAVSTALAASDFAAGTGTLLSNYVLPVSASGTIGTITPAILTVALTGTTAKVYDGTNNATLTGANYQLSGLVAGESLSIGKTSGLYSGANAGNALTVSTSLAFADFAAGAGTLLSNYVLPVSATGTIGTVTPRSLTVTLIGESAKTFDNSDVATLTGANYQISGLLPGESITISKTTGAYGSNVPDKLVLVTANLTEADYVAGPGTSLSNYALPTSVSGAIGTIKPIPTAITATINVINTTNTAPSAPPPPPPTQSSGSSPSISASFSGGLSTSFLPEPVKVAAIAAPVIDAGPAPVAPAANEPALTTTTGTAASESAPAANVTGASSGVAGNIATTTGVDGNSGALLGRSGGTRDVHDYANRFLSSIGLGGLQ
jgi:hypothetical protein